MRHKDYEYILRRRYQGAAVVEIAKEMGWWNPKRVPVILRTARTRRALLRFATHGPARNI